MNRYLLGTYCVPGMGLGTRNGVTRPSVEIHSSKTNKDKCTIETVTSTVKAERVVLRECAVRGLDLGRQSFLDEGAIGLNQKPW